MLHVFRKMKIKKKHRDIAKHYARFVNKRDFPEFVLTEDVLRYFSIYESQGRNALTEDEKTLIKPMISPLSGKAAYELRKKQLYEDVFFFWTRGFGWAIPILADIEIEFKTRHGHKSYIFIKELIAIIRKIQPKNQLYDGTKIVDHLLSLRNSVFTAKEINKILSYKIYE